MEIKMKRVLSGIRPTGDIHLGNYLGAIRNWVETQNQMDENLFCIVDLHALTTLEDVKNLVGNTRIMAAAYIASGINPARSSIFVQSHVPAHTELSWIFSCITPMGWLNRMTQFKEKAGKHRENACLGLLAYPVRMAADVLNYKATHVPVGGEQQQQVGEWLPKIALRHLGSLISNLKLQSIRIHNIDHSESTTTSLLETACICVE